MDKWSQEQMLEVVLKEPDDFLKVRETLSRMGVASRREEIVPLRRTGRPSDIGDVAVFLLSDLSTYVTGQQLMVDGGLSASLLEFVPRTIEQDQHRTTS